VYLRYFCSLSLKSRVAHERLVRICFGDYDRELALVAEHESPAGNCEIVGVGRISRLRGCNEAEVAVVVSDNFQKLGLGGELLRRAIEVARAEKISALSGEMLPDNLAMQVLMKRMGFRVQMHRDFSSSRARLDL
jgi:acetyltransferase